MFGFPTDKRKRSAIQKVQAAAIKAQIEKGDPNGFVGFNWEHLVWDAAKGMAEPKKRTSKKRNIESTQPADNGRGNFVGTDMPTSAIDNYPPSQRLPVLPPNSPA